MRTPATLVARRADVDHDVHVLGGTDGADRPPSGVVAAAALGVSPDRVLKTLVVRADDGLALAVVPADARLDERAAAAALGADRVSMAATADAERATGYRVGGLSPIGGRRRLPTLVDASAMAHETVFVSAGRRGVELELAPGDLVSLTGAAVAALTR